MSESQTDTTVVNQGGIVSGPSTHQGFTGQTDPVLSVLRGVAV